MKTIVKFGLLALFACYPVPRLGAAPFVNFGFEDADTTKLIASQTQNGVVSGVGAVTDLLPGWSITDGQGIKRNLMSFNQTAAGNGVAVLWENSNLPRPFFADGKYSVYLNALDSLQLSQSGEVPLGMNGLQLLRSPQTDGHDPLIVSMNSEPLSILLALGSTNYVYDVSKFAGKTVNLELTVRELGMPYGNSALLGSLNFIVPEPSPLVLAGLSIFVVFITRASSMCLKRYAQSKRSTPNA